MKHFECFSILAGISVVGAIGTGSFVNFALKVLLNNLKYSENNLGAHGSSLKHKSSLSEPVIRLTFINGTGLLRTITSSHWDMNHFRIHLGLLGIIVDVTLETVPLFKMTSERSLHPESILSDGTFLAMAETSMISWKRIGFPQKEKLFWTRAFIWKISTPPEITP